MDRLTSFFRSISKIQWLAIAMIIIGIAIMIPRAMGMLDFSREVNYAIANNFAAGNPSPDLLRPWMSIRYIAVAYGVPEKYIFDALKIQPRKESGVIALDRLNRVNHGNPSTGTATLLQGVRSAILAYRANPVVTGLIEKHVEGWMTVQYIANSTGIPIDTIFTQLKIPAAGNAYKPLDFFADEIKYTGGPSALVAAVQKIVDSQGKTP